MDIDYIVSKEGTDEEHLSFSLNHIFKGLDDDTLREIVRVSISLCSVRIFGIPETPEEHGKQIRAVCRALERSAAPPT